MMSCETGRLGALLLLLLLGVAVVLVPSAAFAATVRVPQDAGSIQAGINVAGYGDTVLVQCGVYHEHDVFLRSGVVVQSESGDPSCVTVVAGNLGYVFRADGVESAVLRGIRVQGGRYQGIRCADSSLALETVELVGNRAYGALFCVRSTVVLDEVVASGNYSYSRGGAVECRESSLTIRGSNFTSNEAGYEEGFHSRGLGGAIHAREGSVLDVRNTVFDGNLAWLCGGGVFLEDSEAWFIDCEFVGNEARLLYYGYDGGGGLSADGSSVTVVSSTFIDNSAEFGGGFSPHWGSDYSLTDVVFRGNIATGGYGGGLCCFQCPAGGTLTRCLFEDNEAATRGGGAYFNDTSCSLDECVFVSNASGEGGAGALVLYAQVDVSGCTFYGNSSPGACIEKEGEQSLSVSNTIIAGTLLGGAVVCESGPFEIVHSCIFGNAGGDSLCGDYPDNLFIDPLFCSPDDGVLWLCADSPCLPGNTPWGELVGAFGEGCGECGTAVERLSWGNIKAMFR